VDCIVFFVYLKCCNGATTKQTPQWHNSESKHQQRHSEKKQKKCWKKFFQLAFKWNSTGQRWTEWLISTIQKESTSDIGRTGIRIRDFLEIFKTKAARKGRHKFSAYVLHDNDKWFRTLRIEYGTSWRHISWRHHRDDAHGKRIFGGINHTIGNRIERMHDIHFL